MRRLLVLGMVLFGVVLTVATPAQAAARMQIGEIWYNSPGSDRGGNASLNHEWVQLHNTSGSWITMTGWTLRDPKHHVYTFGTYKIKPHGYVKIHTGKGTNTQTDRYWGKAWYVWNNTGDTATLRDNRGRLLDQCTYKGKSQGYVFC
jgi:Lamin Tail Domain